MRKPLNVHGGYIFHCDHCQKGPIHVDSESGPEGWSTLQGFTDKPGETLHACTPDCSHFLKAKHARPK